MHWLVRNRVAHAQLAAPARRYSTFYYRFRRRLEGKMTGTSACESVWALIRNSPICTDLTWYMHVEAPTTLLGLSALTPESGTDGFHDRISRHHDDIGLAPRQESVHNELVMPGHDPPRDCSQAISQRSEGVVG